MKYLLDRPHILFWSCIPLVLIAGISHFDEFFVFNVYDTYFVVDELFILLLLALVYAVVGLRYWLKRKREQLKQVDPGK